MANVRVDLKYPIYDGMPVTFKAPCDCTAVTGIIVYYPSNDENASTVVSKAFSFKDAHGTNLSGLGNLFAKDAYVSVILDVNTNSAYIQNANTNSYLEDNRARRIFVVEDGTTPPDREDGDITIYLK